MTQTTDPWDIAIIGMACRFPGAAHPRAFWDNLVRGVESITFFSDEELRAEYVEELKHGGKPIGGLTVSLGVALFPYHADQATTLLREADEALYQAKEAGRDRVVVSDAGAASRGSATPKSRSAPAS